jgi:hypothetical protein
MASLTLRELFDEREREEIIAAMHRRESDIKARIKQAKRGETSRGVTTIDLLEVKLELVQGIIKSLLEEHT